MVIEAIELEQDKLFRDKFMQAFEEVLNAKKYKNITELAKKLNTRADVINEIKNGKRFPTVDQLRRLLKIGVNPGAIFETKDNFFNIVHAGYDANAGHASPSDIISEFPQYGIPGLNGDLISFNIKGDSMEPSLLPGDLVICERILNINMLIENQIYIIVFRSGDIRSKRLRFWNENNKLIGLELLSDNRKYPIEQVNFEELEFVKIFKVKKRLTEAGLIL